MFCVAGAGISTRCKIRGRRRSLEGCKNVGRRGGFQEGLKRVAGVVISRSVMSMFGASDAESVGGLQISCHGSVTLQ